MDNQILRNSGGDLQLVNVLRVYAVQEALFAEQLQEQMALGGLARSRQQFLRHLVEGNWVRPEELSVKEGLGAWEVEVLDVVVQALSCGQTQDK
jgi:hypothetical protein